ncbi:ubiquitin-conjugating enzyme E2 [Thraustotheca clavata]|uniref:E2 ubiquitin-conjugating enzyme n=1 Tax=Thraustotheca clavata TaxID=74557 RepID=A0A1W0A9M7_9STRA|nr:ubiquitin-conjugating enzyme E2 [Thraustotheca clavata]
MSTHENFSPQIVQRVAKEIRQLATNPPIGIRLLEQDDASLAEIHVEVTGPEETPYVGGFFEVKLVLTDGFPAVPPKGVFLTKIFHPNIASNGEICVNTLKRDWNADLDFSHILQVIRCLLIVPYPESSLNDKAGKLFMECYEEYARRAKILTSIHATKSKFQTTKETTCTSTNVQTPSSVVTTSLKRVRTDDGVDQIRKKIAKKKSLQRI